MSKIDLLSDDCLTLAEAAKILPRGRRGKKTHVSTLWRWASCGLRGVRLETIRKGGMIYTSREALRRFFARLSGHEVPSPEPPPSRQAELGRMRKRLERAGLKTLPENGRAS